MKVIIGVWESCKRLDDGKHASCEICGEKLSCGGGSTSALRKHLRLLHPPASNVQIQILSIYKQTFTQTSLKLVLFSYNKAYMIDLQAF